MICRLLLGLVLGMAAADGASAQKKEGAKAVYGAGLVSCGQWQQYRLSDTNQDRASRFQLQAWIDGFLSGYNLASDVPDFIAASLTDPARESTSGLIIIAGTSHSTPSRQRCSH
jgi:hypothetical protein